MLNLLFSGVKAEQVLNMMGANVIVSNMRGSARPIYMAGARMATMYPMSIISPGVAINVTCLSYAGNVDFGITIDPVLVPQAWSLIDGLEQALGQYLTLAGGRSGRRRQAAGSKPAAPVAKKRSRRKGEGTATQARAPGARSRGRSAGARNPNRRVEPGVRSQTGAARGGAAATRRSSTCPASDQPGLRCRREMAHR